MVCYGYQTDRKVAFAVGKEGNMKKSTWLLLCLCLVIGLCMALAASADVIANWTYALDNGEITITKCDPATSGEAVVPLNIDGYPVTGIMFSAFKDCENITSIYIPDSIKSIGAYAFSGCKSLMRITVDKNNPYFSSDVQGLLYDKAQTQLLRCPLGKTECSIAHTVENIGWAAFEDCTAIKSLILPDSVTGISPDGFRNCSELVSITIPASVKSIGWDAFTGCSKLCNNTGNCIYIKTADNPCYYLLYVTRLDLVACEISPYCKFIAKNAFDSCEALTGLELPAGLLGIGDFAFADCAALQSITIPAGVTSIGQNTFYGCKSLREVSFADGSLCKSIGAYAFGGCDALADVYYFGTEKEWKAIDISAESITEDGVPISNEPLTRANLHIAYPLKNAGRSDAIVLAIGKRKAVVFGKETVNDVAPKIVRDRTMLPIRFVAEALGAKVDWNVEGVARKAIVEKGDKKIEIQIDSLQAWINGVGVLLDTPAFIENDRTYLPLRFVVEALDAKVEWVPDVREIIITK